MCKECKERVEREDWKDYQDKEKKEEDIIVQYSNKILGIEPDYYRSYDQNKEYNEKVRKMIESEQIKSGSQIMEENMEAVFNRMMIRHMPKPGMTDKEWSNAKRLAREETRQICSDSNLRIRGTANRLIQDRIDKIPCDCKTEEMRAGKFCKTCRLLAKVNDYMLSLLKEASEDRSTVV